MMTRTKLTLVGGWIVILAIMLAQPLLAGNAHVTFWLGSKLVNSKPAVNGSWSTTKYSSSVDIYTNNQANLSKIGYAWWNTSSFCGTTVVTHWNASWGEVSYSAYNFYRAALKDKGTCSSNGLRAYRTQYKHDIADGGQSNTQIVQYQGQ
jgi:hypothetical protein